MQRTVTKHRLDVMDPFDYLIIIWLMAYLWVGRSEPEGHVFPQGHTLALLSMVILLRGLFAGNLKQAFQLWSGSVALLATAGLTSGLGLDSHKLQVLLPAFCHAVSFHLNRLAILMVLGVLTSPAGARIEPRSLLRLQHFAYLRTSVYAMALVALLNAIEPLWRLPNLAQTMLAISASWVLAYTWLLVEVYRLTSAVDFKCLRDGPSWRSAIGGTAGVATAVLLTVAMGLWFSTVAFERVAVWLPYCLILVIQVMMAQRILNWADARSARSGRVALDKSEGGVKGHSS